MKKTNREVLEFVQAAQVYVAQHKEESKFTYALQKLLKRFRRFSESIREDLADVEIEHCATDSDGIIKRDIGQLVYTKEGLRARNKAQRDLLDKEVEVESYFVAKEFLPNDISIQDQPIFEGFVIEATE